MSHLGRTSGLFGLNLDEIRRLVACADSLGGIDKLEEWLDEGELILQNRELQSEVSKLHARLERINRLSEVE